MTDRKTIFAVKLRSSRLSRDLMFLALILAMVCFVIVMIAAAQLALCASSKQRWTVKECLIP